MAHQLKIIKDDRSPFAIGSMTYLSFLLVGTIPLIIYVYDFFIKLPFNLFTISCFLTAFAFIIIGWLKSYLNQTSLLKGIVETLALGTLAALVAYFAGQWLESLIA